MWARRVDMVRGHVDGMWTHSVSRMWTPSVCRAVGTAISLAARVVVERWSTRRETCGTVTPSRDRPMRGAALRGLWRLCRNNHRRRWRRHEAVAESGWNGLCKTDEAEHAQEAAREA